MKKILIIEDDAAIADIVQDFLTINHFESTVIHDGGEGLTEALKNIYDLILLDVMLPTMDGIEVLRQLRNEVRVPILLVTAKSEELDKLRGLGLGADDYISKPFSPTELVARVRANLAQVERLTTQQSLPEKQHMIGTGDIVIQPEAMKVFVREKEVVMKHKEFELLLFLMENIQRVFSKEELYEKIWGMESIGEIRTVAVHINRLREKIEENPSEPVHIQTVWGAGYRFIP
ncbi:DNA-binding response regulator (plasmid) [Enterococcus gilvus]|jgi:DNA-binding response OmpR family regulator|uniref:response regulator transcription factor n=1 Tax=Enterococcus gilvus TaxID=160453 RepID=UPI000DF623D2|nr:response regulator transcription factor [Enterococcus gilvus]AXG39907.1 DNA-binding response regulator [Enterococcus gilvus]